MSELFIIDGELSIDLESDGEIDLDLQLDGEAGLLIPVYPGSYRGNTVVTPAEHEQTLPTEGLMMSHNVTVNPIPEEYIVPAGTKAITSNDTYDVTEYAAAAVNVPIPPGYIIPTGSETLNANGTYDVTQYAQAVVDVPPTEPVLQDKTVSPSTSSQVVSADAGYDGLDEVTVNAMPAGSATTPNTSITANPSISVGSDGKIVASVSGSASVTPAVSPGYVAIGTAGTVSVSGSGTSQLSTQAAKTVTPSTSQQTAVSAGKYTTGDVKVAAIPSQYIVPTGTKSITENGAGIDVAQYAAVNVAVPSGSPNLQTKSVDPSESTQTVTPDSGYDGLDQVNVGAISSSYVGSGITRRSSSDLSASGATVTAPTGYYASAASKSVASGSEGTPTATKGTVSNHSVSVTPKVTNSAGYIAGGTKTGTAVTVSASELVSGSETKTENGAYDVTNLAELVVNVSGGGGSSKNTQVVQGTTRTTSSALTAIGAEMTVDKTGIYDVYWSAFRSNTSSSYTYGTQLYIDGTAHGTQNTTWSNHVQNNHLTGVSLTAGQKIRVYGRNSRGSSYYIYAPTLVIVES